MTVTTEVKVGRRRVISYFLYPLLRGLDESIREP
jgi:HlyD family secretion protein